MKRLIPTVLFGLVFLAMTGYVETSYAASKSDAFIGIKKKALKKDYNYLAMAPLDSQADLKMPESVRESIESAVIKQLEKEGFKVMPPKTLGDIRQHMRELVGLKGALGKKDIKKEAAVRGHSYRELLLRHKVDGIVAIRARVVGAPFQKNKAKWDGTSQNIQYKGDGLFSSGKKYAGTIAASSLQISILDRREVLLYHWSGGIEVLMQRNAKKLEALPADQFWQDKKRIQKAVKTALSPL